MQASRHCKKIPLRAAILAVLLVATVLLAGYLSNGARESKQHICLACGNRKTETRWCIFRTVPLWSQAREEVSAVAVLRDKYLGPCLHDWQMQYWNVHRYGGGGFCADRFLGSQYPMGRSIDTLKGYAAAIERLPTKEARIMALKALGNKENCLRWLAVYPLDYLPGMPKNSEYFVTWWAGHSNLFQIETNRTDAKQILDKLEKDHGDDLGYYIDEARYSIERDERLAPKDRR
ncbi:MAG: hypothetical protein WCO56_17435 [Verrucomicrobiota bacterium]